MNFLITMVCCLLIICRSLFDIVATVRRLYVNNVSKYIVHAAANIFRCRCFAIVSLGQLSAICLDKEITKNQFDCRLLIDFSLTVKAATLILISGRGMAISSAK